MARPDDIVGYTFQASTIGPCCIVDTVLSAYDSDQNDYKIAREITAQEAEGDAEDSLRIAADILGIDLQDEWSYDSGDFPKVIFRGSIETRFNPAMNVYPDECESCGETFENF